ncbi:MAG TPA: hypothetical protein VL860_07890, partial [Planctomycetota bacterium]|nr:hypothetical protein [Planctomycetota bacterium]
ETVQSPARSTHAAAVFFRMGLFDKLFGGPKKDAAPTPPAPLPAPTADASHPPAPGTGSDPVCGLQILYAETPEWLPEDIAEKLTGHHTSFATVQVDRQPPKLHPVFEAPPGQVFHIAWDRHAADLAVLEIPLPAPVLDTCLQGAFFSEDLKREASHHRAHALLWYAGQAEDRLEQMVALTLVAGALGAPGGLAVVNENGCTATSLEIIRGPEGVDPLAHLQQLPIPMLYAGVKIFEIPHHPGAWARTFGCSLLHLPDLAVNILQHGAGEEHLMLVSRVLAELAAAKTPLAENMGMKLNDEVTVRFRLPHPDEFWLESPTNDLFVLEVTIAKAPPSATAATPAVPAAPDAPSTPAPPASPPA